MGLRNCGGNERCFGDSGCGAGAANPCSESGCAPAKPVVKIEDNCNMVEYAQGNCDVG